MPLAPHWHAAHRAPARRSPWSGTPLTRLWHAAHRRTAVAYHAA